MNRVLVSHVDSMLHADSLPSAKLMSYSDSLRHPVSLLQTDLLHQAAEEEED